MKKFRLFAVSRNLNSFGLRGCILVARDGEAWEIGSNDLNCPQRGKTYGVIFRKGETPHFENFGWEIPMRLPTAPDAVIIQAWTDVHPSLQEARYAAGK